VGAAVEGVAVEGAAVGADVEGAAEGAVVEGALVGATVEEAAVVGARVLHTVVFSVVFTQGQCHTEYTW